MFIAYEVSIQLVTSLRELIPQLERFDRDLADQLRRAASSVVLNLAEGSRSAKGNKQKHFAFAHGSANEVKAALELLGRDVQDLFDLFRVRPVSHVEGSPSWRW